MASKSDDTIEYDFEHYEDPTLGYKPFNKSDLIMEVIFNRTNLLLLFHLPNQTQIHDMLSQLTESLSWEIGTTDLDNQTAFRALELMWWLDSSDWTTLYNTIKIGTSYSQETIQFVRFILTHQCIL